jgi:hypothetical protein
MSDEGQDTLKKYIEIDPLQASQEALQKLMLNGDLSSLNMQQRAEYVFHYAVSKGLDPASKPFDLIVLNNKLTLYANRSASDQIRKRDGITTERLYFGPLRCGVDGTGSQVYDQTVWEVEYKLSDREGRVEFSTGCVGVENMKGDAKGNAVMKADTKAKRRGTLAMGGLGIADESEVESFAPRQDIGEGRPRRVYPRAITPQEAASGLPDVDDMPIIEATLVDEAPVPSESLPPAATPQSTAAKPPAFPRFPTAKPPVKPPVRV